MRTKKSKATIDKLPEKDREIIFTQCEQVTLVEGVEWLVSEYDLRISVGNLSEWLKKRRDEKGFNDFLSRIRTRAQQAKKISKELGTAAEMNMVNTGLLGQMLFESFLIEDNQQREDSVKAITLFSGALGKELDAQTRLFSAQTSRIESQIDIAKVVEEHAAEIKAISADKSLTTREQIDKIRLRLFGPPPVGALEDQKAEKKTAVIPAQNPTSV